MNIRRAIVTVATAVALLSGAPAAPAAERGHAQGQGGDRHQQTVGSRGQHGDRHGGHWNRGHGHGPSRHYAPHWRGGWDPRPRPYYHAPRYYGGYPYGGYPWAGYAPLYYRPRPVYPLYPAPYGPNWSFSFGWSGH